MAGLVLDFSDITSSGTGNNTYSVTVTLSIIGNGVSYNGSQCPFWIWEGGWSTSDSNDYQGTHSFTTSTSKQQLGSKRMSFTKGTSARTVTIWGEYWTDTSDFGVLKISKTLTIPAGNYTYTVTYNSMGGTVISNQTVSTGGSISINNGISRVGYTFGQWLDSKGYDWTGWSTNSWNYTDGQWGINNNTLALKATWTPITYSIIFHSNPPTEDDDATTPQQTGFVYDSPKQLNANTWSFTGYNFKGWNKNSDDSGQSYGNLESVKNLTTTSNGIVHLYAIWIPEQSNTTLNKAEIRRIISTTNTSESLSGEAIQLIIDWTRGKTATTLHNITYQLEGDIVQSETSLTTGSETQGVKNIIQAQAFGVGGTVTLTIRDYGTNTPEPGTALKTITKELQIPTGGFPVHINQEGTAIQFFGLANSSDSGVYAPSMTPDQINNFIDNLNQSFRGTVNWIVEEGDSGNWHYRKWDNGKSECWLTTELNLTASTRWPSNGYAYYDAINHNITFPTNLFIETPIVFMSLDSAGGYFWLAPSNNKTKDSLGTVYVISPNEVRTAKVGNLSVEAKGRWK